MPTGAAVEVVKKRWWERWLELLGTYGEEKAFTIWQKEVEAKQAELESNVAEFEAQLKAGTAAFVARRKEEGAAVEAARQEREKALQEKYEATRTGAVKARAGAVEAEAKIAKQIPARLLAIGAEYVNTLTAGDDLVCQVCEDISEEGPYSLDEAQGLLPAHPNCRCAFVPALTERTGGRSGMIALPLRYLIAVEDQLQGVEGEIIEVGYDGPKPDAGGAVRYCNLFDQTGTGRYGPYLDSTDTAAEYDERVVNPLGAGWRKLLSEQCSSAWVAGFDTIEWDNPDGYQQGAVLTAVQYAADQGLKVLAKNPLICDWDPVPYVKHPAVVGIVVEKDDDATAAVYDDLRKAAGKPDLPIYFVAFKDGDNDGTAWATATAKAAANYESMFVTISSDGEYTSSVDVLPVAPSVAPAAAPPGACASDCAAARSGTRLSTISRLV